MSINSNQDRGSEWNHGQDASFYVKASIGNFGKDKDAYVKDGIMAQEGLNVIMIATIIVGSMILRRKQRKFTYQINERNVTPSDYGLMVTGIPINKSQDDVINFFKKIFKDIDIVYINYCYDVKDKVKLARKIAKWHQKKAYLIKYKNKILQKNKLTEEEAKAKGVDTHPPPMKIFCKKTPYETIEQYDKKIKEAKKDVKKYEEEMERVSENKFF